MVREIPLTVSRQERRNGQLHLLAKWTDQAVRNSSNSVHGATAAVDTMGTVGARIYELYRTTGPYDLLLMAEVPDQQTAPAVALALGRGGNVRATVPRAFDRAEMLSIATSIQEHSD